MIWLYQLATSIALGFIYPYGRIRASFGNELWRGRLGMLEKRHPNDIWIHASSAGEVKVISHIVDYLLKRKPQLKIMVTAMTPAGYSTAQKLFGNKINLAFFPLDTPITMRRAIDIINPRIIVLAETEIWPNLVLEASAKNIDLILVNGRMTEKSFNGYQRFSSSMTRILGNYDRFFFKSEEDASRYRHFGVNGTRSVIAGDMKFSAPVVEQDETLVNTIREQLGADDKTYLLVAGSTRKGEEEILLDKYKSIKDQIPSFKMAIVPRHIERSVKIASLIREKNLPFVYYGEKASIDDIVLVNKMGMLNELYLSADISFVGGTLVDIGGHNILEPVWAGTPVLYGPSTNNVRDASNYILNGSYGALVVDGDDLVKALANHYNNPDMFVLKTSQPENELPSEMSGEYILRKLTNA